MFYDCGSPRRVSADALRAVAHIMWIVSFKEELVPSDHSFHLALWYSLNALCQYTENFIPMW